MSYSSEVLADAPIHYWRFANSWGVIEQDLGSDPVPIGMNYNYASKGYAGVADDGGSTYIVVGQKWGTVVSRTRAFSGSIEAWFYPLLLTGAIQNIYCNDGVVAGGLFLQITALGQAAGSGDNAQINTGATHIVPQTWNHLVYTHSGSSADLYLNNVHFGPVAGSSAGTYTAGFFVGGSGSGGGTFQGFITEVAHYNGALSAARVSAHFNAATNSGLYPAPNGGITTGITGPTGGGSTSLDLTDVLAAIRKHYANSP